MVCIFRNYIDNPDPGYTLNYHFLSNSGMFLPLANLGAFQTAILDPVRGPQIIELRKAARVSPRVIRQRSRGQIYSHLMMELTPYCMWASIYLSELRMNLIGWTIYLRVQCQLLPVGPNRYRESGSNSELCLVELPK